MKPDNVYSKCILVCEPRSFRTRDIKDNTKNHGKKRPTFIGLIFVSFFLNIFYVYDPIELKISMVVKHIKTQLFYCQSLTQSFTQSGKLGEIS